MDEYPRCPNCGNNVVESWLWCRHCGYDPYAPAGPPGAGSAGPTGPGGGPGAGASARPSGPAGAPYGHGAPPGSGYGAAGYAPPGYGAPGYAPPGYGAPGYAPPGYGAPGYAPPGYGPGSTPPLPPRKSAGAVVAILVAAVILIPILLIGAVTVLGRNSTSKFSSVGSAIDPGYVFPTTSFVPTTAAPPPVAGPPTTAGRRILPDWTDVTGAGGWKIAFPNKYIEDVAPIGPFGATGVREAKSVPLRDAKPVERLEVFVLDTAGVSKPDFTSKVRSDMIAKLGYPAIASKNLTVDGRAAIWFEPHVEQPLLRTFTSVIAVYADEVSYLLVAANGSGTAGQDDLLQQFANSLDFN